MARRYGRNQKRAARAALEVANRQVAKLEAENTHLERTGSLEKEAIRLMQEVLGEYFIALDSPSFSVSSDLNHLSVHEYDRLAFTAISDEEVAHDLICKIHRLSVIRGDVFLDELRQAMCVRLSMGNESAVALNLDTSVWQRIPTKALVRRISDELAYVLAPKIQKFKEKL